MSGRFLAVNVLVGLVGILCAAGLIHELVTSQPLPSSPTPRLAPPAPAVSVSSPTPPPSPGAYGVIASRNLFSPSRSETPAGPAVAATIKPFLHGVVMDGPKSRAYLEDPAVKRTFGYGVGDAIGDGRVQSISHDRVVIARPDGPMEVLLQDPAKPRPAIPVGAVGAGAPTGVPSPAGTVLTRPFATPPPVMPGPRVAPGAAPARGSGR